MEPYLSGVAKNGGYLTEQELILEINFASKLNEFYNSIETKMLWLN